MSSSYTVQDTLNFVQPIVSNLSLTLNTSQEPARTIANTLLTAFYGPPFVWEHNRATATWTCVAGTTDYPLGTNISPGFGFLESAYITVPNDGSSDANRIFQLSIQRSLEKTSDQQRPAKISVFSDNGTIITIRLFNVPDKVYSGVATYQQQPTLIASNATLSTTFWPMPDKYIHIVNYGFLTLAMLYANDPRWVELNQKFVAHLLGAQEGLDENQKNLFLQSWLQFTGSMVGVGGKVTQGIQARGA